MDSIHPENVATLLVIGGLATLLLRHILAWRLDPGRSQLPWVLISATGIGFGVLRVVHLSTLDPARALLLTRAQYVIALLLSGLALATMEVLTEQPRSRATVLLLVMIAPLGALVMATPWFVAGPAALRHDALGHPFWAGHAGWGLLALVPLLGWTGVVLYRRVRDLPGYLTKARRWLRLVVAGFVVAGVHDSLLGAGAFRSLHLFEYAYLLFALGATQFETHRGAALRARLAEELEARRQALLVREAALEQARRELETTHARLVRADRLAALGTLAAGTAHEINNPLTFVVGNAELLTEELDGLAARLPPGATDDARALLGDLAAGAARIRRVVEQLLVLARDERTTEGPVDVRAALDLSLAMASHHLKHRARVVREFAEVPPVRASEAELGQVFLNLLVNAAQAIPEGHLAEHTVRVSTRAVDGKVVIEVADTGVGMTPEVRARVFDPFFTTKEVGHGTGLGLSISLGIVTRLGGTIDCTSEPGRGTTFRVELPALAEVAAAPAAPPLAPTPPRARGVLVVADEELVARTVARMLANDRVEVAFSDREALGRPSLGGFDVIVSDLMMPDLTGLELYELAVAREPAVARRFVFLTGGVFSDAARQFLERHRLPWLTKPVSRRELSEAIDQVIAAAGR